MDTRKLYYENAYTRDFYARVTDCAPDKDRWAVTLDATAFFPEEGGQTADKGVLGAVRVLDVRERAGAVVHYTDGPLVPGKTVWGHILWPERFRKMQTHTAEHILSGLAHRMYGCENVGFHLSADSCTLDFDRELDWRQLALLERRTNEAVWDDRAVHAWFPRWPELAGLDYRSKLDLKENVRIVTVEGVDDCACCAPHVSSTGQIGLIKITEAMRHRGGVRLWMKAGPDALTLSCRSHDQEGALSGLLNAPRTELEPALRRLMEQRDELRRQVGELRRAELERQAESLEPTAGSRALFVQAEEDGLRALANAGAEKCGGVCAVFSGQDGAYRFVMASAGQDMRAFLKQHGPALQARGGGQERMVSGRSAASREALEAYFAKL